ncbi:hypothetical protein F5B22DRAFT_660662 [Xylaria bambusicola]|uniref:uncharacterized protein n=1 Tax=Xylaria bambusicola TaxID=326684 RepID=UPI0020079C4A|nr:uncharacterized protein F5B22DRAFT_660662 [Xylaria bambusicola]KAI0506260.1 hypothetical protein F5B22DRAFT_660662 [Xylaria bambusicola]
MLASNTRHKPPQGYLNKSPRGMFFRVHYRHVNCRSSSQSDNSPVCEFSRNWDAHPTFSDSALPHTVSTLYPAPLTIQICCLGWDDWESYGNEILRALTPVAEHHVRLQCEQTIMPKAPVSSLKAFVVWQGSPPRDPRGKVHGCLVTEGHLEMMRDRNCGDYIQVEFESDYSKEKRSKKILRKLSQLPRRAR